MSTEETMVKSDLKPVVDDDKLFKQPAVPVKRINKAVKKVILDEDVYFERMGKIIQRDFFPDLEKLKAQNEYLDAVLHNDVNKLREVCVKYSSGSRLPSERYTSPSTFETPLVSTRSSDDDFEPKTPTLENVDDGNMTAPKDDKKLSLDQYLSLHTSEDNESFADLMKKAELRHRLKHAWLYKEGECQSDEEKKMLTAPPAEEQNDSSEKPLNIDTWKYKDKNFIMYVPDGVDLTPEEKLEMAKRKQSIVHSNTRLAFCPFNEEQNKETLHGIAQMQARTLEGKIDVDGKEVVLGTTPHINGFSFVKTPSPAPGVDESPLITWGEIEGTPIRLDGSDTPLRVGAGTPSFRIAEPPKREKLALALAEKAIERYRNKKSKAMEVAKRLNSPSVKHPSSSVSVERLNSMSPAARKFVKNHLKTRFGVDKALQASYSPASTRSNSATPLVSPHLSNLTGDKSPCVQNISLSSKQNATPNRTPVQISSKSSGNSNKNLTDNLLKLSLPKRPKASDFF